MVKLDGEMVLDEVRELSSEEAYVLPDHVKWAIGEQEASDVLASLPVHHDDQRQGIVEEAFNTSQTILTFESHSVVGQALDTFAGSHEAALSKMRSAVEDEGTVYLVAGYGYDYFDRDLLGGTGDGTVHEQFAQSIDITVTPPPMVEDTSSSVNLNEDVRHVSENLQGSVYGVEGFYQRLKDATYDTPREELEGVAGDYVKDFDMEAASAAYLGELNERLEPFGVLLTAGGTGYFEIGDSYPQLGDDQLDSMRAAVDGIEFDLSPFDVSRQSESGTVPDFGSFGMNDVSDFGSSTGLTR